MNVDALSEKKRRYEPKLAIGGTHLLTIVLRYTLVFSVFASLWGCASFYSAAILGHDAVEMPFPDRSGSPVANNMGLSLKTTPTISLFSYDSTQSVQLGATFQSTINASATSRFCLSVGAGAYFSQNDIYLARKKSTNPSSANLKNSLDSFGYLTQGKLSFVVDQPQTSPFVSLEAIYNSEYGDYLRFRKEIASPTSNSVNSVFDTDKINLSPDGSSLDTYASIGNRTRLATGEYLDWSYGFGVALSNWPSETYYATINKMVLTYSIEKLWWFCSVENLGLLNLGISIGVGTRI